MDVVATLLATFTGAEASAQEFSEQVREASVIIERDLMIMIIFL